MYFRVRSGKEVVGRPNRKLRVWANYFNLDTVSRAYHAVNYHVTNGYADGSAGNTRSGVLGTHGIRTVTCTRSWNCTSFAIYAGAFPNATV